MTQRLALLSSLLLACACGVPPAPSAPAPADHQESEIVNGSVQSSSTYRTVGMLSAAPTGSNAGTACSGSLIAPNVVLTAGHCAYGEPNSSGTYPFIDVGNGWDALFIMATDANNGPIDSYVKVRKYIPHPQFDHNSLQNDIALVILERNVTGDGSLYTVWPYAQTDDTSLDPGHATTLLFVGYGITSPGGSDSGTRRAVNIPTADYNDQNSACWQAQYSYQGQFCYTDGYHGTCQGDSGGPAIQSIGGVQTIVGVTSFGDGSCVNWGVDTRTDYYASWIQQTINNNAGQSEDCGNGVDDDGDGKADCQDPDCQGSPKCPNGVINAAGNCQTCNATIPCQTGLTCVKSSATASSGTCQATCSGTCSGTASCGTFLDDSQACTCSGQQLVADGANCYYNHYCHLGSKCVSGTCQPRCDNGFSCQSGFQCNTSTNLCEAVPTTTASSTSGGTTASATTATSTAASSTAGSTAGATTAGSTGGDSGTTSAGSTGGTAAAGSTTGTEPTNGAAGGTVGGIGGGTDTGTGGNGAGVTSGTTGNQAATKKGCASADGTTLLPLLALLGLRRRRS